MIGPDRQRQVALRIVHQQLAGVRIARTKGSYLVDQVCALSEREPAETSGTLGSDDGCPHPFGEPWGCRLPNASANPDSQLEAGEELLEVRTPVRTNAWPSPSGLDMPHRPEDNRALRRAKQRQCDLNAGVADTIGLADEREQHAIHRRRRWTRQRLQILTCLRDSERRHGHRYVQGKGFHLSLLLLQLEIRPVGGENQIADLADGTVAGAGAGDVRGGAADGGDGVGDRDPHPDSAHGG
jgi:hypothetical protein